jgi:hypothetical protein
VRLSLLNTTAPVGKLHFESGLTECSIQADYGNIRLGYKSLGVVTNTLAYYTLVELTPVKKVL